MRIGIGIGIGSRGGPSAPSVPRRTSVPTPDLGPFTEDTGDFTVSVANLWSGPITGWTNTLTTGVTFNTTTKVLTVDTDLTGPLDGVPIVLLPYNDEGDADSAVGWFLTVLAAPTAPYAIGTVPPLSLTQGEAYTLDLAPFIGGTRPVTLTVGSGSLPSGLSISGETITGTLTTAQTGSFVIHVTNGTSPDLDLNLVNFTVAAAGSYVGAASFDGDYVTVPLPSGITTGTAVVDPSKFGLTQTVPTLAADGTEGTTTRAVLVGYDALVASGVLRVYLREPVSQYATALAVSASAGAITQGATSSSSFSGAIQPSATPYADSSVKARLIRLVNDESTMLVAHDVVDAPFFVEASCYHQSGVRVKFTVSDGTTTQTQWTGGQTRSRYRDYFPMGGLINDWEATPVPTYAEWVALTDAQWTANLTDSGNAEQGGLGVFSHPTAFDPADFLDGALTITMTAYAIVGGSFTPVSESWTVYNNDGGTYTLREVWCDTVDGSDSNSGLTALLPMLTLSKAVEKAGSTTGGATSTSVPVVYVVGSGDADNPRSVTYSDSTASTANARAGVTDTWVTVQPASGIKDVSINCHGTGSNGATHRVRRLKFKNLLWDVSRGTTGADVYDGIGALKGSTNYFPNATNPQSVCWDDVAFYHPQGTFGQTNGSSSLRLGTSWGSSSLVFLTNSIVRDMYMYPWSTTVPDRIVNSAFVRCTGDLVKGIESSIFGLYANNNQIDRLKIGALSSLSGTAPTGGETISGTLSDGVGIISSMSGNVAVLSSITGSLKLDDNKSHLAVTVSGISGTFQIDELVNGQRLYRKDGNILRFKDDVSFPNGTTLTGATSGATATVSSSTVSTRNIFIEPGGVGTGITASYHLAYAIHPDGLQIQGFKDMRYYYTVVSGTPAVGNTVSVNGQTDTVTALETSPTGAALISLSGNGAVLENNLNINFTLSGGAVIQFTGVYDTMPGQTALNGIVCNFVQEDVTGQSLFGENGSKGWAIINVVVLNGDAATYQTQFGRVGDFDVVNLFNPQRNVRNGNGDDYQPRSRTNFRNILSQSVSGMGRSGDNVSGINAYEGTSSDDILCGDWGLNNTIELDAPYVALTDYAPGPSSIARRVDRDPCILFDPFGNAIPATGAAAGGVEAWPLSGGGATAPAQMSAPTVTALSSTSISVDRAAAPADGGSAITSYDLRWSVDGAGSWTTVTGITDPQTVSSLVARTAYEAQTRAVNAIGAGDWSTSGTVTTPAPAISIIGTTDGNATTLTMPGGQLTGDLLVVFAGRTTNGTITLPGAPGDWTLAHTETNSDGGNSIVAWRIASAGGESVGTWTGATYMGIHVIRNATGIGGIAGAYVAGAGTPSLPALTMTKTDGTSTLFGGIFQRGSQTFTAVPSGYTKRSASAINGRYRMDYAAQSSAPSASFGAAISGSTSATVIHAEILNG